MVRRQLLRWGVCLGGGWLVRSGWRWYAGRDGNMALRLAEAGTRPDDVHREHPYGDGSVPVGFPSSVPLMARRQVVETTVLPREKKTYWRLTYWTEGSSDEVLRFHQRELESAGWTFQSPRRVGKEGVNQGGWLIGARRNGLEAEVYLFDRGSSGDQAVQITVEEPRG